MARCHDCGYRRRGVNHDSGRHHRFGVVGRTHISNETTGKVEERERRGPNVKSTDQGTK